MPEAQRTRVAVASKPPAPLSVSLGTTALILLAAALLTVPILLVVDISSDLAAYGQPEYYRARLLGAIAAAVVGLLLAGASVFLLAANQAGRRWAWSSVRIAFWITGLASIVIAGLLLKSASAENPGDRSGLPVHWMALVLLCPILWGLAYAYGRRPAMRHFGLVAGGSASDPPAR